MPPRLNLGCGPVLAEGWTNFDRDDHGGNDVGDMCWGLPYADGTFHGVVANHVLSLIAWPDLHYVLGEVRRVTLPGGYFRVLLPNLVAGIRAYEAGLADWFPIFDELAPTVGAKFCRWVDQAGATRSVWTPESAPAPFLAAGWGRAAVVPWAATRGPEWLTELDSRQSESFILEAW